MANAWTGRVAIIDSVEDKAGSFLVERFEYWAAAADNDLEIQDAEGEIVWKLRAKTACPNGEEYAKEILQFAIPPNFKGLYIKIIDGGTLYIHKAEKSPT